MTIHAAAPSPSSTDLTADLHRPPRRCDAPSPSTSRVTAAYRPRPRPHHHPPAPVAAAAASSHNPSTASVHSAVAHRHLHPVPNSPFACVGVGVGVPKHEWSDADEFTLLAAAVAFRERNGHAPRLPDMAELFDSICDSISPHIDKFMVYYKMKRLKSKFQHSDGPRDRRLRNLCSVLWGVGVVPSSEDASDAGERSGVPDAAAMMLVVAEVLGEYWKTNERVMAGVPLEKGLSLLGKKEGRLLETKWRQQLDEEMRSQMRQHDLAKEVCGLLTDAIKGLGS